MAEKAKAKGRKIGRNKIKCANYDARNKQGNTVKARRVARSLLRGVKQPGWIFNEAKTKALPFG